MARVAKHSLFEALSGGLAGEIVFKRYANKTVVSRYPDMSKVKASPRQVEQRLKMKEASAYASRVMRDPQLRAPYEKDLQPGESVFHKAKNAFLRG